MEYGLRAAHGGDGGTLCAGLNPCFNGISSAIHQERRQGISRDVLILVLMEYGLRVSSPRWCLTEPPRLNPCFDGIWSAREKGQVHFNMGNQTVLILVLMEYGLRVDVDLPNRTEPYKVLILVLMEYGLREVHVSFPVLWMDSLNPCFDGIWSASSREYMVSHDFD